MIKIAIGSDHAGFVDKQKLLQIQRYAFVDLGTNGGDSVDYPDFANKVCEALVTDQVRFGVLICGSGQGMAIRANKFPQIRAAVCWNAEVARLARAHNNANVLCLGSRTMNPQDFPNILDVFLAEPFEGGRHQNRVAKLSVPAK